MCILVNDKLLSCFSTHVSTKTTKYNFALNNLVQQLHCGTKINARLPNIKIKTCNYLNHAHGSSNMGEVMEELRRKAFDVHTCIHTFVDGR